jgi:glyoxylase-like metal-dependent hydrolase (beta-lactamase superfamily II)
MSQNNENSTIQARQDTKPEHRKPVLDYPCGKPPQAGETREVAPGVHWIRMPMPFALTHINLWAIEDGEGWAIVDSGLHTPETIAAWQAVLAGPLGGRPVTRIFATHMHPDHMGMAGWFTRAFNCRLWMTRLEYLTCRVLVADTGREAPEDGIRFYREAGWDQAALDYYRKRFGNYGKMTSPLPESYQRLQDGQVIRIGRHDWRVVTGNGHSPEHACLVCEDLKLMFSGDQVLPGISSNVSVFPTEPDADPLGDWIASLDKIRREVPNDVLVLPAHNEPFRGLHERLSHLAGSHARSLDRLREALQEPRRVVDVFSALFHRPITSSDPGQLSLATGEGRAHLNYLVHRGEAVSEFNSADGAIYYRLV